MGTQGQPPGGDRDRQIEALADALMPFSGGTKLEGSAQLPGEVPTGLFGLAAAEGPYERVIICRSLGTATVYIREQKLFIVPNGRLHALTGQDIGYYTGVFRARMDDDLLTFPPAAEPPYDKPSAIPDFRKKLHPTKAVWRFANGSVFAVGPANSYVIPLKDRSAQLAISIAMVITGGTKDYKGARGTISSLGATWFPYIPDMDLKKSLKDRAVFEAKGVHGFRLTLARYQAQGVAATGGYEQEEEEAEEIEETMGMENEDEDEDEDYDAS
jgi:hypothetical protein